MIPKVSHLERKLGSFIRLSGAELTCLAELQSSPIVVKRGKELVHEGQSDHKAYILQQGWACSFKLLPDGGRQIIGFPIAGDCIGLRSVLLRTSDHSFSTLTDAVVSVVETAQMMRIFADLPRLAAAILWATSRDEAMIVEHLVSVGRRNAIERTAHFFLELGERLHLAGVAIDAQTFPCPISQYALADALGLTAIHVNRVLRQLRERGLLTLKDGIIAVHDAHTLKVLAGFESQAMNRPQ